MGPQIKKYLSNPDSLVSLFLGVAVVAVIGVSIANYVKDSKIGSTSKEGETSQTATESSTLPATYTVAEGDTLWSISTKTIGSGYNWVDIADANKLTSPNDIEVGQKLAIPKVEKREAGQMMAEETPKQEIKKPTSNTYTVKPGDSLWKISEATYGTGYRWSEIAKANKLEHPNIIHAGNVLTLPQ